MNNPNRYLPPSIQQYPTVNNPIQITATNNNTINTSQSPSITIPSQNLQRNQP
jgi:hypothetical protein